TRLWGRRNLQVFLQSGRPDLNRRPLDMTDLMVLAGPEGWTQIGPRSCRSWTPNRPQQALGAAEQRSAALIVADHAERASGDLVPEAFGSLFGDPVAHVLELHVAVGGGDVVAAGARRRGSD